VTHQGLEATRGGGANASARTFVFFFKFFFLPLSFFIVKTHYVMLELVSKSN
jgi:hypothetical protein